MAKYTYNHTHFTTASPEKLVDFYTKVMGGAIVREMSLPGGAKAWDINLGGLIVRISSATGGDESLKKAGLIKANVVPQFGLHHLAMNVDNMDEAYTELKSKGAEFILPPTSSSPGSKVAFILAPENVLFELIERR